MQKETLEDQKSNFDNITRLLESKNGWEIVFNAIPDLIAILDNNHRVVMINQAMEKKLKRSCNECVGDLCYRIVHQSETPPDNCPHKQLLIDGLEHKSEINEDNLGGCFDVTASPIKDVNGTVLGSVHVAHDITNRKEMEEKLEKTLKDKEILMKEIYHRVKNNLMIISSLLSLQSSYITDEATQDIFRESQNRTNSMALIHEKLYRSGDLKSINFTEYLETLSNDLYRSYAPHNSQVQLKLNVEKVNLDVDTSIPLGLILNELLTNSLKHAFPNGMDGEILIELLNDKDGNYQLSVSDNGVGFPEDIDYKNTESLGMQIVNNLTYQIDGEIHLDRNNGTKFTIHFST
jgi:PAS domain S-box-containing protein